MIITVKETSTVKPAEDTPREALWLSNLDLMTARAHVPTVYFYKRSDKNGYFFDSGVVKDALARVLVHFYPVAGRYNCTNRRPEIDCNAAGVLFVVAETSAAIDDINYLVPSMELRKALVPTVDPSTQISSIPLMVVQITYFKCGAVSLGIGIDHRLCDGTSAYHFISSWAELARGLDLTNPPLLDRKLLSARDPPQPQFDHIEYKPPPAPLQIAAANDKNESPEISIFKITRNQITALKEKSKESGDDDSVINYTTYETLAGHVWRCVTAARSLPDDQKTKLFFSASGRTRIQPPVPNNLFANVIFAAGSIATAGDLKSRPARYASGKIRGALSPMGDEYSRSALDYLEARPEVVLAGGGRGAETYASPNLGVISWTRLPAYGTDFGWGPPFYAGPLGIAHEGKAYILPPAVGQGDDDGLFVAISLQCKHMKVFEKLFYDI